VKPKLGPLDIAVFSCKEILVLLQQHTSKQNNHETKQKHTKQTKIWLKNQQLKNKSIYFCGATKQFWLLFKVIAIRLVTNWCQLYRKAHNISLIQNNEIPRTSLLWP
jgi:hypothetical protein